MGGKSRERKFILVTKDGKTYATSSRGKAIWYSTRSKAKKEADKFGLGVAELKKSDTGWAL